MFEIGLVYFNGMKFLINQLACFSVSIYHEFLNLDGSQILDLNLGIAPPDLSDTRKEDNRGGWSHLSTDRRPRVN